MFHANRADAGQPGTLDRFDRVVILYLLLPLPIFLLGWLEWWAAIPLTLCVLYALKPLAGPGSTEGSAFPISRLQLVVAVAVGCVWTLFGGIGHLVFANSDWLIRDAVLHDLIVSPWPVGYGVFDGRESLLRAPLGFYMPAALVGKSLGLWMGHLAMGLWTAMGAALFLLQVLSLTAATRVRAALAVAAVIVFFSGFDIIGELISTPGFLADWSIAKPLEWWAGSYQYSSLTTQLFWVPNHTLAGWLTIGLLYRGSRSASLDAMLPMILVGAALWSPLSALGLVPFVVLKVLGGTTAQRLLPLLHPRVWAPALLVGLVLASYLVLDSARLPVSYTVSGAGMADMTGDLLRLLQFFLLEVGFIGFAILALRGSWPVAVALVLLLFLPVVNFGPGNDLVMRASIPSLAILAIAACLVLTQKTVAPGSLLKKRLLVCMLAIGAVTAVHEFGRAIVLPAWPVNLHASLIEAACGQYPPHYTAHLDGQWVSRLIRPPHRVAVELPRAHSCLNPAIEILGLRGLL